MQDELPMLIGQLIKETFSLLRFYARPTTYVDRTTDKKRFHSSAFMQDELPMLIGQLIKETFSLLRFYARRTTYVDRTTDKRNVFTPPLLCKTNYLC